MEYRILGPLDVHDAQGPVALGGHKPRAILALLLLNANAPVSSERLAVDLWNEDAPQGAIKTVQVHVSRLRKALADPDVLVTTPAGYVLRVLPGELDADRFAQLSEDGHRALADGRPEDAAATLSEALSLWRGPPLADLAFEPFAQLEITRLEEQRLAAIEARVDADMRQHRHPELVGELSDLVGSNPTRERLVAQLMLALYRCGRQADALDVYRHTHERLDQELGLEPGPALKTLQRQILEQAPSLDAVAITLQTAAGAEPTPLPMGLRVLPAAPWVGRVDELALLARLTQEAAAGARRVAFVGGEPGVGKTRLVARSALDAHASGFSVGWGASAEDLSAPYATWIGALSHLVEHAPREVLAAHVAQHGGAISRLVRSLSERVSFDPPAQQSDPEIERYLLFGAVAGLLESICATGPLVIVLDDLQWADKQSLALLGHVARASAELPLLILLTYRHSDLGAAHPLGDLLAGLRRVEGIERISLEGLAVDDVASMMATIVGLDIDAPIRRLALEITVETGGNPFFVGEMLRHMRESGALRRDSTGRWRMRGSIADLGLPQSLHEVVGRRVLRLGTTAQSILTVAAVLGATFDVDLLERLVDVGEDELLAALDAAIEGAVIIELPEVLGRFAFAHELISHSLYATLGATRRARMHQRAATALEALVDGDPGARIGELAHHWAMARSPAHATTAARYARLAGEHALEQLAPDEAIRWFQSGLEQLAGGGDEAARCDLLIGLGLAKRQLGDAGFRDVLIEASELAEQLGDHDRLTRAVIVNTLGPYGAPGPRDEQRIAILERALERVGTDWPYRPRMLAILGKELYYTGDAERGTLLSEEALALARGTSDRRELARVMAFTTAFSSVTPLEPHSALVRELTDLAAEIRDPELRFQAAHAGFINAMHGGDREQLDDALARMVMLARAIGEPILRWSALWARSAQRTVAGDLAEGERLTLEAAAIAREHDRQEALVVTFGQLVSIRTEQGRLDELGDALDQQAADNPGLRLLTLTRGFIHAETGRLDAAATMLAVIAQDGFRFPYGRTGAFNLARCGDIAIRVGARPEAAQIYEVLLPHREQFATTAGISSRGSVELVLGRLAGMLGNHDAAKEHLAAARGAHERFRAPLLQARTSLALGEALMACEERERALDALTDAATLASRFGGEAIVREAAALRHRVSGSTANASSA